eukprot:gb/GECG01007010.1/.p1 GENE.gb/GECG01007010.1/~~gb/GECG01007010.1/.p1  ORF type:complete len:210 (+),score=19.89 gb/GECG01007010.1/:1-630(+)
MEEAQFSCHASSSEEDVEEIQGYEEECSRQYRYGVDKVAEAMDYSDNVIRIRYRAEISPDWPLFQMFCCGPCKYDKLLRRTYFHVHENRIEYNYPIIIAGIFVIDRVGVMYFDRCVGYHSRSKLCTPYHCCFVLESCGQVMKEPVSECCTPDWCNCLFGPLFRWYPGLYDAEATAKAVRAAYDDWLNARSAVAGAGNVAPAAHPEPESM